MNEATAPEPHHQSSLLSRIHRKPSKIFSRYKRKIILQVILILAICLLIILERIFNETIIDKENQLLKSVQSAFRLQQVQYVDGHYRDVPTGITSTAVRNYSYTSYFKLQFLLITHLIVTLYVGVNALIAATLMFASLLAIFVSSFLQLIYSGPRPFWISESIFSANCLPSFNHPSRGSFLLFFVIAYAYFLFLERSSSKTSVPFNLRDYLIKFSLLVVVLIIEFIDYCLGEQHLVSIALGFIYFVALYCLLRFLNVHVDSLVRRSTIMTIESKRYSFYWLLYLSLAEMVLYIVYSNLDRFAETGWIKNFLMCDKYQEVTPASLKYDEIIGGWYVFLQTATVLAWIGGVFGISYCFRTVRNLEWYRGSTKQRFLRVLIANLMMIPSWLFITLVEGQENDETLARRLGVNDFIVDATHFFLLYLWLFGYMPVLVYGKLLKILDGQIGRTYQLSEFSTPEPRRRPLVEPEPTEPLKNDW